MERWLVTSAWPYSSDTPHLGNLIGSVLSADVYARFQRLAGNEVLYVSGSDEHGTPVEVQALRENLPVFEVANRNHERISSLFKRWNISYDNYTRTESSVHHEFVREIYSEIYNNDQLIFVQTELIHFCPKDQRFLPDRFVEGICPYCGFENARGDQCDNCGRPLDAERLANAHCVICGSKTVLRETKQWFFDLPKLSDYITGYLSRAELSENVIKFCRGWLKEGLRPRSITRDSKWGIKAPFPGAENKTIYVWMDAVLGYVSAVIEYFRNNGEPERWKDYWFVKSSKTSFFIGKDNIPFHAIILPALLHASGKDYNEPNLISSTEFLLFEGQKFSKSRKVGIWIDEALELLPADYWRFSLISLRPEGGDINFGWDSLEEKINNDLNDSIGNFVNRTLVGVKRFAANSFSSNGDKIPSEYAKVIEESIQRHREIKKSYEEVSLQDVCRKTVFQASEANKFLSLTEPWKAVRTDQFKALQILYVALSIMKLMTIELSPLTPESCALIAKQAGLFKTSGGLPRWDDLFLEADLPISTNDVKPIFNKVSSASLKTKLESLRASKAVTRS